MAPSFNRVAALSTKNPGSTSYLSSKRSCQRRNCPFISQFSSKNPQPFESLREDAPQNTEGNPDFGSEFLRQHLAREDWSVLVVRAIGNSATVARILHASARTKRR